jgi:hypothetical protein
MSASMRSLRDVSAPVAGCADVLWFEEHATSMYRYVRTQEDVAYVLDILQSESCGDPRAHGARMAVASAVLSITPALRERGVAIPLDTEHYLREVAHAR